MCYTIDSGLNFSDHLPLVLSCQLPASPLSACQSLHGTKGQAPVQKPKRYRWDKADLMSYYFTTDHYLSSVDMTAITKMNYCPVGCHCEISRSIDTRAVRRRRRAAAAADRVSASRRRRFRDVFTSCCSC